MNSAKPSKLGLIVNPRAGLGGRVGLKGSDGIDIQQQALTLGAIPQAGWRATEALTRIAALISDVELITPPAEMGEDSTRDSGFEPDVIGNIVFGRTTAHDTRMFAEKMVQLGVDLILFAGGDGTARDIFNGVGFSQAVLGIPAGVKMYSSVYAINPAQAGDLAADYLSGRVTAVSLREVMDLDEDAMRSGRVDARLYGYLTLPFEFGRLQSLKTASPPTDAYAQREIGRRLAGEMREDCLYIIGPGTTTQALLEALGIQGTLIGVDVVYQRRMIAKDVSELDLLKLVHNRRTKVIITQIGGQGFLFGRGNQQISPTVLKHIDRRDIIVVVTPRKLQSLSGRPFLIDTGDPDVDRALIGYIKVITGAKDEAIYRIAN